jgi:hypothetical protein
MNETANETLKPHPRDDNWIPACFSQNRQNFPWEELLKYAGKHIAWSWDGTRIAASADTLDDLFRVVASQGIRTDRVVYDYVDLPDEPWISSTIEFDPVESDN